MAPELEISLLGPPRVTRAGRAVSFDTRKATALLAHLALADRPRSREALCALLWPNQDPEHARGALRRTLSVLRKAVGEEWIDASGDTVALRDGVGLAVDARTFRSLAGAGATSQELADAVALFGGDVLEGFSLRDSAEFEAWHAYEADALQRELGAALGRLVRALLERGDYSAAIPHARRWLALDELHEPAHRELIRLYALDGDRAAALAQYRSCVRTLSQELGVPPTDETATLYEQVSEGTLAPPTPGSAAPASAALRRPRAPAELPLVGRSDALEALVSSHRSATPDGRLAVIEGEAGIGKTRLAQELAEVVKGQGGMVLAARCHDDEIGLPYGPVLELLSEALRTRGDTIAASVSPARLADGSLLLPELASLRPDVPAATALTGPAAHARLLEAICAVLAAGSTDACPGVVIVDDIHAADEATLELLAYLGRRLRGKPIVLMLAWRSEAMPPGHRLRALAAELSRAGTATLVGLPRLGERETSLLVRSVEPNASSSLEHQVYVETEGLPLFVAEYLAAIEARGDLEHEALPPELMDLLDARIAGLGGVVLQVLEAAAVIGRWFDPDTVRIASGRSEEETADALEQLAARGLVRELARPDPTYDFTHDKLRARVYDQISLARRRLVHRRVAETFLRAKVAPERAALVAQHLRLAGDSAGAAGQYRRAAEHAASVLAHRDALDHLDAALGLGYPDAAELHERAGDLRTLVGDYGGALSSYESAAALSDPPTLARLEHKLGAVHHRRGEWDRAEARFGIALEVAGENPGLRSRILADLSLTLHQAGEPERAATIAREALALAKSANDQRAQAQAHNLLGVLARGAGQLDDAHAELSRSLALAEGLEDPSARTAALNNLALVARDAGELDRALDLTEQALAFCAAEGDRHRAAALENNLADIYHAAGRSDESMAHLKRAVAAFSEIGADGATRLPEIWKLVSW